MEIYYYYTKATKLTYVSYYMQRNKSPGTKENAVLTCIPRRFKRLQWNTKALKQSCTNTYDESAFETYLILNQTWRGDFFPSEYLVFYLTSRRRSCFLMGNVCIHRAALSFRGTVSPYFYRGPNANPTGRVLVLDSAG